MMEAEVDPPSFGIKSNKFHPQISDYVASLITLPCPLGHGMHLV